MRKSIGAVAFTAAGLSVVSGVVPGIGHADAAAVGYTATTTPESVRIQTDAGTLENEQGTFKIKAADGSVLAGAELSFRVDDFVFPIASEITGRTAVLTPQFDLGHADYRPVALPFEEGAPWKTPYDREVAAWNRLTSTIGAGASIGTLVGGLAGGAVGCVLGGIAGATVASAAIVGLFGAFIPAAAIGCLGGIVAIGALGTLVGQLLVTAPVAILAAIQYFTTINSPFPGS
ncbi:hypothetical protein OG563_46245 [Nocardia vinacea]|uniref:DUF8020 domain-containing protein n=1 Tax=Nocardia vinacea TaxID=96468 RepID=A0ABZ1YWW1_9NOCA|nr:hypothetical protein [Nocardia vinacea]